MTSARHFSRPYGIAARSRRGAGLGRARRAGELDRCRAGAAGQRLAADGHRRQRRQEARQEEARRQGCHASRGGGPDDDRESRPDRSGDKARHPIDRRPHQRRADHRLRDRRARHALPSGRSGIAAAHAGEVEVGQRQRPVQGLRAEAPAGRSAQDRGRATGAREAVAGAVRREPEGSGYGRVQADSTPACTR